MLYNRSNNVNNIKIIPYKHIMHLMDNDINTIGYCLLICYYLILFFCTLMCLTDHDSAKIIVFCLWNIRWSDVSHLKRWFKEQHIHLMYWNVGMLRPNQGLPIWMSMIVSKMKPELTKVWKLWCLAYDTSSVIRMSDFFLLIFTFKFCFFQRLPVHFQVSLGTNWRRYNYNTSYNKI